ncbi:MAG: ArnT family glycosyltransferase [Blastocatellia bacterium]
MIALLLTMLALGFRLFIALKLPNDEPDDGRLYARIANNLLDNHVYSIATEAPFEPTYIRLPGYPLFLVLVYKTFGRDNNTAARVIQAVVDTLTCWLVAWLAFVWTPAAWQVEKRRRALLIALLLMATCPFLAIYAATLLTEIWTAFFVTLCALAASLGLRSRSAKRQAVWWLVAGLAGGGATSFRPDAGLFVAAVGGTLALVAAARLIERWRAKKSNESDKAPDEATGEPQTTRQVLAKAVIHGALLSFGFALALAPWTIRNARVFGVFMPIAPSEVNMPGEFVPRGFTLWLKTWVTDVKYTQTVEWALDARPIHIEQVPAEAFDSPDERDRIADLLARYNNEPQPPPSAQPEIEDETVQSAPPTPPASSTSPAPPASQSANKNDSSHSANQSANKNDSSANKNDSSQSDDAASSDDDSSDSSDDSSDDSADDASDDEPQEAAEPPTFSGEMTPDIDNGFMAIAIERIRRHPFRYYVVLPLRRVVSLWFDSHAQYYPFQGELFPLKDLDRDLHQQIWLPLFVALTWAYTLLLALGAWVMWRGGDSRVWLLMLALLILPRLAFLSTLQNPEPRYVVEFFTFVIAASSLGLAGPVWEGAMRLLRKRSSDGPAKQ